MDPTPGQGAVVGPAVYVSKSKSSFDADTDREASAIPDCRLPVYSDHRAACRCFLSSSGTAESMFSLIWDVRTLASHATPTVRPRGGRQEDVAAGCPTRSSKAAPRPSAGRRAPAPRVAMRGRRRSTERVSSSVARRLDASAVLVKRTDSHLPVSATEGVRTQLHYCHSGGRWLASNRGWITPERSNPALRVLG